MSQVTVDIDNFTGPLTLLFKLLMQREIDVFSVRLTQIARQVVEAILSPDSPLDADDAGAYLVLCAGLLRLKSRRLLPEDRQPSADPAQEEIIDEEALAMEHLLEYQHYRGVAEILGQLAEEGALLYSRGMASTESFQAAPPLEHVSLMSLVAALDEALKTRVTPSMEVPTEEYTLSQAISHLHATLSQKRRLHILGIFPRGSSRLEIIVLFLGLLELIRLGEVLLIDEAGQIFIHAREDGQVA
ncbi:MAG: segregation and condensation protein A [Bacillota bacterium]|nr:MAG: segregation and condensation protein A [Bacillota bacterium]MBS3950369.1 segregation/condensation protein A [Peptococcaceae bacterium]